jgi:hypothetical protein
LHRSKRSVGHAKIAGEMSDARHSASRLYPMQAAAPNRDWRALRDSAWHSVCHRQAKHRSSHGFRGIGDIGSCWSDKERKKGA